MTEENNATRDVFVFLLATATVIGIAGGGLLWNARRIEKRQEPARNTSLQTQSVDTLDLQLSGGVGTRVFSAATMPGSDEMSWWRPTGSEYLYLLMTFGSEPTIDRVSISSGIGSRIATLGNQRYEDAHSSDENEIYLLRTDTSNGRYRVLGDIYSVAESRIVARRTLLDSPRLAGRLAKTLWNPNGSTLSITMAHYSRENKQTKSTHIIALQTGMPIDLATGNAFLDHRRAIAFSEDGSRLLLIDDKPDVDSGSAKAGRAIVVVDQQAGTESSTAISNFPPMMPLAISDDAKWVAYAFNAEVQLWNTQTGEKTTTLPARTDGRTPWQTLKAKFLADGELVALADKRTVSVYETESGTRIRRYPDIPPNEQMPILPLHLEHNDHELVFLGLSLLGQDSQILPGPWMHRMTISHEPSAVQSTQSVVAEDATPTSTNTVPWTAWMTFADYDDEFKRQTANRKYPITVVGRNDNGKSQFRAQFVDWPSDLDFFSHHNMTTVVPRLPLARYHSQGYRELWTQWFVDEDGVTRYNTVWTKRLDHQRDKKMDVRRRPGENRQKRSP